MKFKRFFLLFILLIYLTVQSKEVNSVPYRPEYFVPASIPVHKPPCFVPEKIPAVPAMYRAYRPISGNTGRYRAYRPVPEKSFFFFFFNFNFNFFINFVIFEFLLGQNGNLFTLTYQYYLFSQYAMVTFKLSIFYIVFFFFF